ncbi:MULTISPECIES: IclR family transcriptional regulator C-terminal domain-containing protein [Novosphingobium]|uniref:Helix-turn-helix domain-containing protein n=1 Tax=Novosphingobium mangrovi (ex Hu et al. 2023) TaxID=2930094 RepID=A0ABT0AFJ0_9SPHN|nr:MULTISPECIES: IclR family transcriptional regulator C-terminal domain-containing protein [Novosphingobium]MCJ1961924.1 helix-turn-helix domain-containing protein [Novosphingobium mangrovi (ex Hu et al. 2023)]GAM06730.1 IclR family transcriptional regulator [Novosphingobium sp. MBES04]
MEKGVPIRSITRSISALKAINRHGSLSMMEIAKAADVPYPTACRIVQTLLYEGLIEQEPSRKRYRPTALVQTLATGFQHDDELVRIARPHIVGLTKRIGWPVSIAIRVGREMMLRDSTHSNSSLTFEHYYPGFTLPILDSASGKVSMAYAPDEEREMILRFMRVSQDIDLNYLATAEVSLDVERIRAEGYAVQGRNHFNLTPGKTSSVSVPIFRNGHYEAALTMVFFVAAMRLSQALELYLDDLKGTAQAISHDLSNPVPGGNA